MNEYKNKHKDGEFYDDDGDRYISVEHSIMILTRKLIAGRMPETSLEDFLAEMDQWVKEKLEKEQVLTTPHFEADVKFYLKKKKFFKITNDIRTVLIELNNGNLIGDKLDNIKIPENAAVYKVRVANSLINIGKSNGFRVIYYLATKEKIYLVTIYSKKDGGRSSEILNDKQIELLVKHVISE